MWKLTENACVGVVLYNWNGKVKFGLPLCIGDIVEILEENDAWYRGRCPRTSETIGIFPKSFIHLKIFNKNDQIFNECTATLREWYEIWKNLFLKKDLKKFKKHQIHMALLIRTCSELRRKNLNKDEIFMLEKKVTSTIDLGNRTLGLDLVPRMGSFAVDETKCGIVLLHQAHISSAKNSRLSLVQIHTTVDKKNNRNYHLYFQLREFNHVRYEDLEIYFYLYDANPERMCAISERFLIRTPAKEEFKCNIAEHSTIFTDLDLSDINSNLYFIVNVMRVGPIIQSETIRKLNRSNNSDIKYRRPYGVSVCNLSEIIKSDIFLTFNHYEADFSIKLYYGEEKFFSQLHEFVIRKETNKFYPISSTHDMVLSMKLKNGEIRQTTSVTRKIGFADIFLPSDIRNDLFLTLENGYFEMSGRSQKNVEVSVFPLESSGRIISNSLWSASNSVVDKEFRSIIIYHNNCPNFNEHIKIIIPPEIISESYILFEFKQRSTKPRNGSKGIGFSFLRLTKLNGTVISNGLYELYVYKYCENPAFSCASYLKLPCYKYDDRATQHNCSIFPRNLKQIFRIKIFLCSMKLTQNSDIVSLLKWKQNPATLYDSLTGLLKLDNEEVIKNFPDIFEALFAIFATNNPGYSGLVFHILINIFNLLRTDKFEKYKSMIDDYIEVNFSSSSVHNVLLSSIQICATDLLSTVNIDPIVKCFESLDYIFKFIIKSKKLYNLERKTEDDLYKENLFSVFKSFYKIIKIERDENVLNIQTILLKKIELIFEQLKGTQPTAELAVIAKDLLNAIPNNAVEPVIQAKLKAFKDFVSGYLFVDKESRIIILQSACTHLRTHIICNNEPKLCFDIFSEILLRLHEIKEKDSSNEMLDELKIICHNLLALIIEKILSPDSKNILSPLVTVLLGLLQELNKTNYNHIWDELSSIGDLKNTFMKFFLVFKTLLVVNLEVFPKDWFIMKLAASNIICKALEEFGKPIVSQFLNGKEFNYEVWWTYFGLAVSFITQPCLQLEKYNENKRSKIIKNYGDMRILMCYQILDMWSKLGENKLAFIPSMVGPFLEVTLISELSLRKAVFPIFYDMMECEQSSIGSIRYVQAELIDKLDILINQNKGDKEYKDLFCSVLLEKINAENPTWKDSSAGFLSSVTELLQILLDYRSVLEGSENREKRMSCIVNLLNFYKDDIREKKKYIRYIYKLHDLHIEVRDYAEAGLTLKLYYDKLSFDRDFLIECPNGLDSIPEWELKKNLCYEILKLFQKGKCWEKAIPLCKLLADVHETKLLDYVEVGNILRIEQTCFQNILSEGRHDPEYFQVNFYGMGFPSFVRNKKFIYRGLELERVSDFIQRLQIEYPKAEILTKSRPPESSIPMSSGQFLQIIRVRPIAETNYFNNAVVPVPDPISKFYLVNDVKRFQNDRPTHKGTIDKNNEFKTLWIERTILETNQPFPGILRWFEITKSTVAEISPIQFACETMETFNNELLDLNSKYEANPLTTLKPYTMRIQGVIDANVQGGISKYQEAFFNKDFLKIMENATQARKLKALISKQAQILISALEIHGKNVPADVMPLHQQFLIKFDVLKQNIEKIEELKKLSESIINTPLPALPQECLNGSTTKYDKVKDIYRSIDEDENKQYQVLYQNQENRKNTTINEEGIYGSIDEEYQYLELKGKECRNHESKKKSNTDEGIYDSIEEKYQYLELKSESNQNQENLKNTSINEEGIYGSIDEEYQYLEHKCQEFRNHESIKKCNTDEGICGSIDENYQYLELKSEPNQNQETIKVRSSSSNIPKTNKNEIIVQETSTISYKEKEIEADSGCQYENREYLRTRSTSFTKIDEKYSYPLPAIPFLTTTSTISDKEEQQYNNLKDIKYNCKENIKTESMSISKIDEKEVFDQIKEGNNQSLDTNIPKTNKNEKIVQETSTISYKEKEIEADSECLYENREYVRTRSMSFTKIDKKYSYPLPAIPFDMTTTSTISDKEDQQYNNLKDIKYNCQGNINRELMNISKIDEKEGVDQIEEGESVDTSIDSLICKQFEEIDKTKKNQPPPIPPRTRRTHKHLK